MYIIIIICRFNPREYRIAVNTYIIHRTKKQNVEKSSIEQGWFQ